MISGESTEPTDGKSKQEEGGGAETGVYFHLDVSHSAGG